MSETLDKEDSVQGEVVPRPRLSLRQMVALLTTAVVAIVLLLAGLSFALFNRHLDQMALGHGHQQLQIARGILAQRLVFYKELLHAYASDPIVRDILAFGDRNMAVSWSQQVRMALPQSLGAGLFTQDGDVLGEPSTQLIGNACLTDMSERVSGHSPEELPIHDGVEGLEHFDMVETVMAEGGERLGLVFVSFALDELNKAMEELAVAGTAFALLHAGNGKLIAASSNWGGMPGKDTSSVRVPDSQWELRMRMLPDSLMPALPSFSAAILAGAGLLIAVMLFFHRLLMRGYLAVIEDLRTAIRGISSGEKVDTRILAEGSKLFSVSDHLADDLASLSARHEDLHQESRTDTLTGLPNRRVFDDALESLLHGCSEGDGEFCVVLMDLDDFKGTNDRYGHACGDLVLQALATAILQVARSRDLSSRWGGDEFALLMPDMHSKDMDAWIERLRGAFDVAQREYADLPSEGYCGVSCGFTTVAPGDPRNAGEVLKDADGSLYRDKHARKQAD